VVVLALRGELIDVEWLLQICSGHLRELAREDRKSHIERCLDGFSEKRDFVDALLAYFKVRELCRNVAEVVHFILGEIARLLEGVQWIQPVHEQHDICPKSLVEGLTAVMPGTKLSARFDKNLLGAVEALARVKVLTAEKPNRYLKLYRRLIPKLRNITIKQIRY